MSRERSVIWLYHACHQHDKGQKFIDPNGRSDLETLLERSLHRLTNKVFLQLTNQHLGFAPGTMKEEKISRDRGDDQNTGVLGASAAK